MHHLPSVDCSTWNTRPIEKALREKNIKLRKDYEAMGKNNIALVEECAALEKMILELGGKL